MLNLAQKESHKLILMQQRHKQLLTLVHEASTTSDCVLASAHYQLTTRVLYFSTILRYLYFYSITSHRLWLLMGVMFFIFYWRSEFHTVSLAGASELHFLNINFKCCINTFAWGKFSQSQRAMSTIILLVCCSEHCESVLCVLWSVFTVTSIKSLSVALILNASFTRSTQHLWKQLMTELKNLHNRLNLAGQQT